MGSIANGGQMEGAVGDICVSGHHEKQNDSGGEDEHNQSPVHSDCRCLGIGGKRRKEKDD